MELRFAQPNILDTTVWNVLAGKDRLLIAALLTGAKNQLLELKKQNEQSGRPWKDWESVGTSMRFILAQVTVAVSDPKKHETN